MKRDGILLLGISLVLTLFGLFIIYDASSYSAFKDFADKYHYIKDQLFWAVIGLSGLSFFSFFDYRKLYNLSIPILVSSIVLLGLVFVPGIGVYVLGAHRWVNLKFFILQSSEFAKLALSIYLAAWFSSKEKGRLPAFLLLIGLVLTLILLEPDMGTAVIILIQAFSLYFLSGASVIQFIPIIPIVAVLGFIVAKLSPYRAQRLETFFNLNQSTQTFSYHVRQILIGLGSGGLTGVGIGNSLQKYGYLPENTTDSIFAIIGEELGFVGGVMVILSFIFVILLGFSISGKAKDTFGKLLAAGITILIAIQALINLSSQTALLPLTGVPLPFISYGGSALIVNLSAIGILINISKQGKV